MQHQNIFFHLFLRALTENLFWKQQTKCPKSGTSTLGIVSKKLNEHTRYGIKKMGAHAMYHIKHEKWNEHARYRIKHKKIQRAR